MTFKEWWKLWYEIGGVSSLEFGPCRIAYDAGFEEGYKRAHQEQQCLPSEREK